MKPEDKARQEIDRQLEQSGWTVQDYAEMDLSAGAIAVREFPLLTGPVDYLLYANAKVIGVVEAKPESHTLTGVEVQSDKYTKGLPPGLPAHHNPLPFAYETTGKVTQFTNFLEPDARSREVFTFHQPEELLRLVALSAQVRQGLRELPTLKIEKLRKVQVEAVQNLEVSLASNRPRALVQMATGTGKTFTAVTLIHRLIKFADARRILFLVDRTNLGTQALHEFEQYASPYSSYKFTDEFNVQHLNSNTISDSSRVCITTVQRLYSILKGEPEFSEEDEEGSLFETESPLKKKPLPVVYNENIPIETFDFIVIDECHRSIYNLWRQVIEYFDAFLIGLTATPTKQTIGFFRNNLVMEYGHEQAVADGVNVGFDVYRIRTKISEEGSTLEAESGVFVPHRDKRTKKKKLAELEDDLTYTAKDLDRDVVSEDQIRLVVRTFRDKLPTEIFPGRTEVPKTLVFAKDDNHADDITRIMREEFGKGNDFCQKITYKTTGKKPETLLAEFRNSYNPRIAVSVDMIATGTDVKPLECLLFMRNVKSAGYFEQMKGRGVRVIDSDVLQSVTPDNKHKTHFVIVDAVGVCEQDKTESQPLDRKPTVSFDKLMKLVAAGAVHPDIVSTLAARLTRLDRQLDDDQQKQITEAADGANLKGLTSSLLDSINPDRVDQRTAEQHGEHPTEPQVAEVELELMGKALRPFHKPKLRNLILNINKSLEQVIDEVSQDELLQAGFDAEALEKAQSLVTNFRQFIEDNKEELEALKLLYSHPHRSGLRYRHVKELAAALERPPLTAPLTRLWHAFKAIEPEKVKGDGGNKLVDVIALVRHALDPATTLEPFPMTVKQRYDNWLREQDEKGIWGRHNTFYPSSSIHPQACL